MDTTIIAAIIGVAATLFATWLGVRLQQKKEAPPPVETSRLDAIQKSKKLRCGAIKHPPLSNFEYDEKGDIKFSGYYIELAKDVAARNGLQIQFEPVSWHEFTTNVFDRRDFDVVLSVFETSDRREHADFCCYYFQIELCAIVRQTSDVIELNDLKKRPDLKWALGKGEAGWEHAVQERGIKSQNALVLEHEDISTALNLVELNGADVAIVDRLTFEQYLARSAGTTLRILRPAVYLFKNSIMIPRDDPRLKIWITKEFNEARKRSQLSGLEARILAECHGAVAEYC